MSLPNEAAAGSLHLAFENLRSARGTLRICVWQQGRGFPDCKKGSDVVRLTVSAADPRIDVGDLAPGNYGISVIHDENDNRRLDKSFIGLPTEGVGFSNNASANFGPPKFEKVRFPVTGAAEHTIRMRYYL